MTRWLRFVVTAILLGLGLVAAVAASAAADNGAIVVEN